MPGGELPAVGMLIGLPMYAGEGPAPKSTLELLMSAWAWEPSVAVGCLALLAGYVLMVRRGGYRISPAFLAGLALLALALLSPLDTLGDGYIFSAHMLQHMLLLEAVPPLLILGIPREAWERALRRPAIGRVERVLGQPVLGLSVSVATLWAWHLPALYEAALGNEGIHTLQHLCFLVAASLFWWPVVAPVEGRRPPVLPMILYLMAGMLSTSALGIILTFAPVGIYPSYLNPVDELGILPLIRNGWGLTPAADQQIGGLLMWVPGGLVYLGAALGILARWFNEPEADIEMLILQSGGAQGAAGVSLREEG